MQTQCPHCQTIFRVTTAHLDIAQGLVRCSQCQHIFDAKKHLIETKSSTTQLDIDDNASESDILNFQFEEEDYNDSENSKESDVPELLKENKRGSWKSLFFWSIITIIFAALLTAQTVWLVDRDMILQHSEIRPWLERFCQHFLCKLPETRDLKSFYMQEHIIRTHPDIEDAIEIQAIFSNRAHFPQPYPNLQLTFSDIHNKPIAERLFKPSDYLIDYDPNKLIKKGASVHIRLEVVDVIENGVESYNFEFF